MPDPEPSWTLSGPARDARDQIRLFKAQGKSHKDAVAITSKIGTDASTYTLEHVQEAENWLLEIVALQTSGGPVILAADGSDQIPWYVGPDQLPSPPGSPRWDRLVELLKADFPVDVVDRASTGILGKIPSPSENTDSRGLVLGYVQSGKTSNFTSVIAKAADAGYKLFVVLSGATNSLRQQTQSRLEEQLRLDDGLWQPLTRSDSDEKPGGGDFGGQKNTAKMMLTHQDGPVVAVIKKNSTRMKRLTEWLSESTDVFETHSTIVIDDEADQASINTGTGGRRTAINRRIKELLEVTHGAYIGYTATPFANVLANPKDHDSLYPKNFIAMLDRPEGYFGAQELFGSEAISGEFGIDATEGHDMIRTISPAEAQLLRPPAKREARLAWSAPELHSVPSLQGAVWYFILASAARRVRSAPKHSSMLVHTTMFVDPQEAMRGPIETLLAELREGIADGSLLESLEELWKAESERVDAGQFELVSVAFEQLLGHLENVSKSVEVVVDNGKTDADQRRSYPSDSVRTLIVIGGNTLSRGLTLEGLTVSYFLRTSTTYDTLLQMGRWFGFKPGYGDLPRVWMTADLETRFRVLATVEEQIRRDIERYAKLGKSPNELATRIWRHPSMLPTARAKMRHADPARIGYDGWSGQTFIFTNDDEFLRSNLEAARSLVRRATGDGVEPEMCPDRSSYKLLPHVSARLIEMFLDEYDVVDHHPEIAGPMLGDYVRKHSDGRYPTWNVVLASRGTPLQEGKTFDFGHGIEANLISRSRRPNSREGELDIGTLNDSADREGGRLTVDLGRTRGQDDPPVLLLYVIDKDSEKGANARNRVDLKAQEHVIGISVEFPDHDDDDEGSYVQVRGLPEPDDGDYEEIEEADREMEEAAQKLEEQDTRALAIQETRSNG